MFFKLDRELFKKIVKKCENLLRYTGSSKPCEYNVIFDFLATDRIIK